MKALFVGALLLGSPAWAGDALLDAQEAYRRFKYDRCLELLAQADAPQAARAAQVALWRGLCAFHLGRQSDTIDQFRLAVKLDPSLRLPPLTSPKVRSLFDAAVAELPPPALVPAPREPPPPYVAPAPVVTRSPVVDSVPWVLGGLAVVGAGSYAFFGVRATQQAQEANAAPFQSDALRLGEQARGSVQWANVSFAAALTAGSAAVISWLLLRPSKATPAP